MTNGAPSPQDLRGVVYFQSARTKRLCPADAHGKNVRVCRGSALTLSLRCGHQKVQTTGHPRRWRPRCPPARLLSTLKCRCDAEATSTLSHITGVQSQPNGSPNRHCSVRHCRVQLACICDSASMTHAATGTNGAGDKHRTCEESPFTHGLSSSGCSSQKRANHPCMTQYLSIEG